MYWFTVQSVMAWEMLVMHCVRCIGSCPPEPGLSWRTGILEYWSRRDSHSMSNPVSFWGEVQVEKLRAFVWSRFSRWQGEPPDWVSQLSCQGLFPSCSGHTSQSSPMCFYCSGWPAPGVLKEALLAAPYCFPLCGKCKPGSHALSS